MRKWFSIFLLATLLRLSAMAQIPLTLQIGATNGMVTVSSSTNPADGYFFGELETTTNLSQPIVWNETVAPYTVTSVASNYPAANFQEFFRFVQHYPVFEFAIFYNLNMEFVSASSMTVTGPVFCNQSIWEGSSTLIFASTVDAVGTNDTTATDPFANDYTASGNPAFSLAGQPVSGAGALNLSIGTNAEAILDLPPLAYAMGTVAAYSNTGQVYLANAADLYITNSARGTNFGALTSTGTNTFIYYQDSLNAQSLTPISPDYYSLKTGGSTNFVSISPTAGLDCVTNVRFASYSFITNVLFYDWREGWNGGSGINGKGKVVQAIQIDISTFNKWLTNTASNGGSYYSLLNVEDKGHPINSVYVYNAVPLTGTTLPAVRVVHGQQLPSDYGFTIATPQPLYILGNYNVQTPAGSSSGQNNTVYTYPAALMADAITILSSNWNDTVTSKDPSVSPSTTTINAACLEGIVQSNPDISGNYSGGVENFLRFLEAWGTLYFNGSIVVMFPSQYATNSWQQTGNYYTFPRRNWAFDTNFTQVSKLPPLTPQVVNFVTP
ncbi:MAG TPA: hypothetical protein VMD27_03045 [Candidatus Aquilonibacter sp.]|nr:hypothetical protein [Candidatus Aquilonibacter sp.]